MNKPQRQAIVVVALCVLGAFFIALRLLDTLVLIKPKHPPGEPMTLGNMRALDVFYPRSFREGWP